MNPNFSTLEANLTLDHIRQYLESQSFNQYHGNYWGPRIMERKHHNQMTLGVMYQNWVTGIDVALSIIDQAQADVNRPEPVVTVIVVDADTLLSFGGIILR